VVHPFRGTLMVMDRNYGFYWANCGSLKGLLRFLLGRVVGLYRTVTWPSHFVGPNSASLVGLHTLQTLIGPLRGMSYRWSDLIRPRTLLVILTSRYVALFIFNRTLLIRFIAQYTISFSGKNVLRIS
jgi:hypothetical protein